MTAMHELRDFFAGLGHDVDADEEHAQHRGRGRFFGSARCRECRDTVKSSPPNKTTSPQVPHNAPGPTAAPAARAGGLTARCRPRAETRLRRRWPAVCETSPIRSARRGGDSMAGLLAGKQLGLVAAPAAKNPSGIERSCPSERRRRCRPSGGMAGAAAGGQCDVAVGGGPSSAGSGASGNRPLIRAAGAHSLIPSRHTRSAGASLPPAARRRKSAGETGPELIVAAGIPPLDFRHRIASRLELRRGAVGLGRANPCGAPSLFYLIDRRSPLERRERRCGG